MQAKNVLYAAVGAPVVAAKKVGDQVGALRAPDTTATHTYTEADAKVLNDWASSRHYRDIIDTAWAVLVIGVPYRYLPIYQR